MLYYYSPTDRGIPGMKLQTLCHTVSDHEGKPDVGLRVILFFFFFLMSKLSRIFGRIRLQLCSWNRLVSGTLPGRNCFCETLLLSLQTQRGKCSFIDRLHPHTCTVTVLPLWLGYKSICISVSFLCAQRMHQICMLNIKLIALKVLPGLRHGFETWCTINTELYFSLTTVLSLCDSSDGDYLQPRMNAMRVWGVGCCLWRHLATISSNRTFTGEEISTCVFLLCTHVLVYASGKAVRGNKNPPEEIFCLPFPVKLHKRFALRCIG